MAKPFRSRQDKRAYHTTVGRIQRSRYSRNRFSAILGHVLGKATTNPTIKDVKDAARSILSF